MMRHRLVSMLLAATSILFLVFFVAPRIHRFVEIFMTHAGVALAPIEIEAAYNNTKGSSGRPEYIPKIIHQIFHNWRQPGNETLPSDWDATRETCRSLNPDFEHHLWTDSSSREFIKTHYSWFLPTYEGYKYPVQRVDSLRYFLMLHFGGIYVDLDNGCSRDLKPLLYLPAWLPDGAQGALSNNILGARPQHPFWKMVTNSLIPWSYNYFFPLVTISYGSGQWFETALWQKFHRQQARNPPSDEDKIYRIIMDIREGTSSWVFFTQGRGGTWLNWDQYYFDLIGRFVPWASAHIILLLVVFGLITALCVFRRRCWRLRAYKPVSTTSV